MIEGVRVLQRKNVPGPYSHTDAMRAAIDNAPDLAEPIPHDERGKKGGRGKKANYDDNELSRGTSTPYLAARIKHDAPEIAARIDEFPSIRAVAEAAKAARRAAVDVANNKHADSMFACQNIMGSP